MEAEINEKELNKKWQLTITLVVLGTLIMMEISGSPYVFHTLGFFAVVLLIDTGLKIYRKGKFSMYANYLMLFWILFILIGSGISFYFHFTKTMDEKDARWNHYTENGYFECADGNNTIVLGRGNGYDLCSSSDCVYKTGKNKISIVNCKMISLKKNNLKARK